MIRSRDAKKKRNAMERKGKRPQRSSGTNKDQVFELIQEHPDGLDDDDISEFSGVRPRQQVQQLCNQLAAVDRIRRESVSKTGKRRKIHNFPLTRPGEKPDRFPNVDTSWRRRLANLVAATGRDEEELLDEALQAMAVKFLADSTVELQETGEHELQSNDAG